MGVFGHNSVGGQTGWWGSATLEGCRYTSPADLGTITKITVHMAAYAGTVNAKALLYADNGGATGALLATSSEVTGIGTDPADIDFALNYAGSPNTPYWLCIEANGNFVIWWDNGARNQGAYQQGISYPYAPNPWTAPNYWNMQQTMYATYTPAGSGATIVTLDGQSLTVTKWGEDAAVQASQWDAWSGASYKRKVKVYGIVRTYTIDCIENAVPWANSLVSYFENIALNGTSVIFYSNQAVRPVNSVSVYVLDVSWTLENIAGQNIRKFTLTLQESQ